MSWLTVFGFGLLGVALTGETGALNLLQIRVSLGHLLTIQVFGVLDLELNLMYWKNLFTKPHENKSLEILKNLHPW